MKIGLYLQNGTKVVLRKKSLNNVEGGSLVFISLMSVLMFSFDNSLSILLQVQKSLEPN
jgi:hypothetical protein